MARVYGEVFHAAGVARELRNQWLSQRSQAEALAGMEWLYRGICGDHGVGGMVVGRAGPRAKTCDQVRPQASSRCKSISRLPLRPGRDS